MWYTPLQQQCELDVVTVVYSSLRGERLACLYSVRFSIVTAGRNFPFVQSKPKVGHVLAHVPPKRVWLKEPQIPGAKFQYTKIRTTAVVVKQ